MPRGIAHLRRIEAILAEPNSDLPRLVREERRDHLEQIAEKAGRIEAGTAKAKAVAQATHAARRSQTMPGVGPQIALAISSLARPTESFRRGRDFAASRGARASGHDARSRARQLSSGGEERHGRISKAGRSDIRHLLIIGAMSRLTRLARRSIPEGSRLARMLHRKPLMLVAIAELPGRHVACGP